MKGPKASSGWTRWVVWGALEACAMCAIGWAMAVGSLMLMSGVDGDPSAWWRAAPGWIGWAWCAKRCAGMGWWRVEGASWLAVGVGILAGALTSAQAWPQAIGWGCSGLMVCLWAWARARVEAEAGVGVADAP